MDIINKTSISAQSVTHTHKRHLNLRHSLYTPTSTIASFKPQLNENWFNKVSSERLLKDQISCLQKTDWNSSQWRQYMIVYIQPSKRWLTEFEVERSDWATAVQENSWSIEAPAYERLIHSTSLKTRVLTLSINLRAAANACHFTRRIYSRRRNYFLHKGALLLSCKIWVKYFKKLTIYSDAPPLKTFDQVQ